MKALVFAEPLVEWLWVEELQLDREGRVTRCERHSNFELWPKAGPPTGADYEHDDGGLRRIGARHETRWAR